MDMFTDVDIFKEIVEASTRGISVYILLDESNFNHFLTMTEKQGCQIQRLRVRIHYFFKYFCLLFSFYSNLSHVKTNQPKKFKKKKKTKQWRQSDVWNKIGRPVCSGMCFLRGCLGALWS